jgi:excinuclease ABC subunit A
MTKRSEHVVVRGAREHNLKGVDLTIPRDALVTFTGVSGSGKSSLAYHTIYREGQRRFLESLSSYARQFLGRMEKPRVDAVEGLSPTVSIDQKSVGHSPRSTVATLTEVGDFLRLWYARLGEPRCPECDAAIERWSVDRITEVVLRDFDEKRLLVLAPVVRERKGEYRQELAAWRGRGFARARIDGEVRRLDEEIELHRYKYHTIELVVDRIAVAADKASRLAEAIEQALALGDGLVTVLVEEGEERLFSTRRACPNGHGAFPEIEPRLFSFNSPQGACPTCDGLGQLWTFAEDLIVLDPDAPLGDGALAVFTPDGNLVYGRLGLEHLALVGDELGFDLGTPWKKLTKTQKRAILHGTGKQKFTFRWQRKGSRWKSAGKIEGAWPGIVPHLESVYGGATARALDRYRAAAECPDCEGTRLNEQARSVRFRGEALPTVLAWSVDRTAEWMGGFELVGNEKTIGQEIFREIDTRLRFLRAVGLGYLTLERRANTLSGGESQRIRLAAQVGAGLRGILYVLDEPSIGLHVRDQARLLETLRALRDRGNSVLVVEHDEDTMLASDWLVDVGPAAGRLGGEVVASGPPDEVARSSTSVTGAYLRGETSIPTPTERRKGSGKQLVVHKARHHNLQNVTARFPLGTLTVVTGVSGSGKSTLVNHVLRRVLMRELMGSQGDAPGAHLRIDGLEHLEKCVEIDQSPIGRTPRSNPATYTNCWNHVRDLFAEMPESLLREYKKGRFSFNVAGGRCETCEGAGVKTLEMQFLAPVEVVCDDCNGKRFNPETLEIEFKGKNVADVLEMTIDEAAAFFKAIPKVHRPLAALCEVGLGYLTLGQPSTTLSGGEAQRVKLATELQRPPVDGRTIYLLDEPTTGLHADDVRKLLACLQRLVDAGNTVIVIEHNLDVIRCADWLLDMGPEGGPGGGRIVCEGTPEDVAKVKASHTGQALAQVLKPKRAASNGAAKKTRETRRQPPPQVIEVRGARKNNLQGVDVDVPIDRFTVVTGPSGSGKTSLAFDTLFSEGQRRFVESLSTYARRFLGRLDRAPVDKLDGLGPAIAIDQKAASRSPRSTVATATEIQDHLRLLYARIGRPHCATEGCAAHGDELVQHSPSSIARRVIDEFAGERGYVLAPAPHEPDDLLADRERKAMWLRALRETWSEKGFVRALADGEEVRLDDDLPVDAERVLLIVDRVSFQKGSRGRIVDATEQAAELGHGRVIVRTAPKSGKAAERVFTTDRSCPHCGFSVPTDPHPRWFSFNHHSGACSECAGLGQVVRCDPFLLVNRPGKPLFDGAIQHRGRTYTFLTKKRGWYHQIAQGVAKRYGFELDRPFEELGEDAQRLLLFGAPAEETFTARFRKSGSRSSRSFQMEAHWKGLATQIEEWFHGGTRAEAGEGGEGGGDGERFREVMRVSPCRTCGGDRLRPAQRAVTVGAKNIAEATRLTVDAAAAHFGALKLRKQEATIAVEVLKEIENRLAFLQRVGLGYLTLDRSAATLSGGEAQRIRLATQLGNQLVGVLYVLDEPTVGLHPRDTDRLLDTLEALRDLGNTVVAVEHDAAVMLRADHVLDMGPGAGHHGGRLVAAGTPAEVRASDGLTGRYLRGELVVPRPKVRRRGVGVLRLEGASVHNLKDVTLELPLGVLTAVTGVSGSGKSSLIMDALWPALRDEEHGTSWQVELDEERLRALRIERGELDPDADEEEDDGPRADPYGKLAFQDPEVVVVDQSPIGTTPSSNPATYTGVMTPMRELFAELPTSKVKGFGPGRFSFNVAEGRCDACEGKGQIRVEMHFLADVWVTCDVCGGRRYNAETLSVDFRGHTIADVLDLEAIDALELFKAIPKIRRPLQLLVDVGLGYLRLGQSATTLSGGEAQRLKLASQLARRPRRHGIFLLDEPTTGLHLDDVAKLVAVLQRLVDRGDTVLVIEHHLDVIAAADHVIELGPEAGAAGGRILVAGSPEQLAAGDTPTAPYLAATLGVTADAVGKTKRTAKKRGAGSTKKKTTTRSPRTAKPGRSRKASGGKSAAPNDAESG